MCDFGFNGDLIDDTNAPILRVSSTSPVRTLAGSIAKSLRAQPTVHLQAMGLAAVYQAMKATIIARDYLASDAMDLIQQPMFIDVEDDPGIERTAIRITLRAYAL